MLSEQLKTLDMRLKTLRAVISAKGVWNVAVHSARHQAMLSDRQTGLPAPLGAQMGTLRACGNYRVTQPSKLHFKWGRSERLGDSLLIACRDGGWAGVQAPVVLQVLLAELRRDAVVGVAGLHK